MRIYEEKYSLFILDLVSYGEDSTYVEFDILIYQNIQQCFINVQWTECNRDYCVVSSFHFSFGSKLNFFLLYYKVLELFCDIFFILVRATIHAIHGGQNDASGEKL